jgi:CBS domain-containing protein
MTKHVHAIAPSTPFGVIVHLIEENRVGALPVIEGGQVVGIVSKSDLLLRVERYGSIPEALGLAEVKPAGKLTGVQAASLMSAPAITIEETATLAEAAGKMRKAGVRRLPVVNGNSTLRGMVTRGDLLRVFLRSDTDIRNEILGRVLPRAVFNDELPGVEVEVEGGLVRLYGRVRRRSDGELLTEIIQHLDGVVGVDSRKLDHSWDDLGLESLPAM